MPAHDELADDMDELDWCRDRDGRMVNFGQRHPDVEVVSFLATHDETPQ